MGVVVGLEVGDGCHPCLYSVAVGENEAWCWSEERMSCFEAEQDSCQSQSWMGCSYPQPIRELFINEAANQAHSWFAHSNLDFITATYGAGCVHYVLQGLPHHTPNAILLELQVNCECHKIAMPVFVQMVAGVCVLLSAGKEDGGESGTKNKNRSHLSYNIKYLSH